jgi:hypothetical protein
VFPCHSACKVLPIAGFSFCSALQRRLQLFAAVFSWDLFFGGLSLIHRKKMETGKLITRWWWLLLVLLFFVTLVYLIWHSQRQLDTIDKELNRPKISQPRDNSSS